MGEKVAVADGKPVPLIPQQWLPERLPATAMPTGFAFTIPHQWVKFLSDPRWAGQYAPFERAVLTDEMWLGLHRINRKVNAFTFRADPADNDSWTIAVNEDGDIIEPEIDCDTSALTKRYLIAREGICPLGALRPTALKLRRSGISHMVIVVCTDFGDYVLDNMNPFILPWALCAAQGLRHQWIAMGGPKEEWVRIMVDPNAP